MKYLLRASNYLPVDESHEISVCRFGRDSNRANTNQKFLHYIWAKIS